MQSSKDLEKSCEKILKPANVSLKKSFKRLVRYFNDDYEKVFDWFMTKNPSLGDQAPLMMIALGRTDKLCQFINQSLDGNTP